ITVYPTPPPPGLSQRGDTLFASGIYATYQWYYDSTAISGATDSFYVATQSGNYNIIVTDVNGCDVGAGIINVVAAAAAVSSGSRQVEVFPNPNNGSFTITVPRPLSPAPYTVEIYNMMGALTYNGTLSKVEGEVEGGGNAHKQIYLRAPAGIYLLKITGREGIM